MILSASASTQAKNINSAVSCIHFESDFFSVIDATEAACHKDVGAALAANTTVWGYKEIRKRACYWEEKRNLIWRIFRSTNIALWQKRREEGFEKGVDVSMAMIIFAPKSIWLGNVGDTVVYLIRDNKITRLSQFSSHQELIGAVRYNDMPKGVNHLVNEGDTIILCTKTIASMLDGKIFNTAIFNGRTQLEIDEQAKEIISASLKQLNEPAALWLLKIV